MKARRYLRNVHKRECSRLCTYNHQHVHRRHFQRTTTYNTYTTHRMDDSKNTTTVKTEHEITRSRDHEISLPSGSAEGGTHLAHLLLLFEKQSRLARLRHARDHLFQLVGVDRILRMPRPSLGLLGHEDPLVVVSHRRLVYLSTTGSMSPLCMPKLRNVDAVRCLLVRMLCFLCASRYVLAVCRLAESAGLSFRIKSSM